MTERKKSRFSQLRVAADVGAVGLEMGISAALGCWGGMWLDDHFGTEPWLLLLGMLAGFGAAFKAIYRTAKKARKAMAAESSENQP